MATLFARRLLGLGGKEKASPKGSAAAEERQPAPTSAPGRRTQICNDPTSFSATGAGDAIRRVPKSPEAAEVIAGALRGHFMFQELGAGDLRAVVGAMQRVMRNRGDAVITQGEHGTKFYVLEVGRCAVHVDGRRVMEYVPGGSFGELALMYSAPRAATVVCAEPCVLWSLDLRTFRRILATTSSAQMMERCAFLKHVPLLRPLSNEQITRVAGALTEESFDEGHYIVQEGEAGNDFYLVKSGHVKCTHRRSESDATEVHLLDLSVGDYFGEMALILDEPRHANVIATSATTCLKLSRDDFAELLGPVQAMLDTMMRIRILKSVPLLANLTDAELDAVADAMRLHEYQDGDRIIAEGESGSKFYIIIEGDVVCTAGEASGEARELMRLSSHEYFGERALLTNDVRAATVTARGPVECLVLDRADFETLLGDLQSIMKREVKRREGLAAQKSSGAEATPQPPPHHEQPPAREKLTKYCFADLRVMRTLGTGSFGRVKLVQHRPTKNVYALKCMKKAQIAKAHQERNVMNEKKLLLECRHPFVLELVQTFATANELMMLLEIVQGGELWTYIYEKTDVIQRSRFGGFDADVARFYAGCVISALRHVHGLGIAYRDLKPENLMMDGEGFVKVIDFGFAKRVPYTRGGRLQAKTFTLCGTPEYLAPELVMSKGHDKSVDYWALGCLIYELLLRRTPFEDEYQSETFRKIVYSDRSLRFPRNFDAGAKDIIKRLLHANPSFRLGNLSGGVGDIMRHPWYRHFDWDALDARRMQPPHVPPIRDALDVSHFEPFPEDEAVPRFRGDQSAFAGF